MASNSSAAAVAALFGIRDGHQQDQIKPLLPLQQQHHQPALAPPSAVAAGPDQPAAAVPPVKKKRTMPGKKNVSFFLQFRSCMHSIIQLSLLGSAPKRGLRCKPCDSLICRWFLDLSILPYLDFVS
jgi:hypothetical protein